MRHWIVVIVLALTLFAAGKAGAQSVCAQTDQFLATMKAKGDPS